MTTSPVLSTEFRRADARCRVHDRAARHRRIGWPAQTTHKQLLLRLEVMATHLKDTKRIQTSRNVTSGELRVGDLHHQLQIIRLQETGFS